MGALAVLQATDPLEETRAMAHRALDEWIDALAPFFRSAVPPKLSELSQHVQKTRLEFLGACLEAAVEKLYAPYLEQEQATCPHCRKRLWRKRFDDQTISTMQGCFTLKRPYFYCSRCRYGFHPIDEALELAPEEHQYDVQEQTTRLGADLPFERAAEHFSRVSGVTAGSHFTHETLTAIGESASLDLVIPQREEIERRIAEARGDDRVRPVLVVAVDGAHIPIRAPAARDEKRPGAYREVKGVRLYLLGRGGERIISVASWHQVAEVEGFRADLEAIATRVPQDQVRIALVADGAPWIWNVVQAAFPTSTQILDYYHCAQHLYTVAHAQYGETLQAKEWVEITLIRLALNHPERVIGELREMKPENDSAAEEIRKLINYLSENRHRFAYHRAKNAGMPIGSGGIESANKFFCHSRMKVTGAWWLEPNSNGMLRIRCAIHNGTFDRVFHHHVKRPQDAREKRSTSP